MTIAPWARSDLIVGQGGHDPAVVRDLAVLERNVEIHADEDALARCVQVPDRELVHL